MSDAPVVSPAPVAVAAPPLWGNVELKRWEPDRTAWLITCVDLTSLLVGFFVLLFSTQTLKQDKWEQVTGSFQAQFAQNPTAVPAVADGANNAVIQVTRATSGLAYLDTLFHQRLEGDAAWAGVVAEQKSGDREMTYKLPEVLLGDGDAWTRLGNVVRAWKNPVGVRVTTPRAQLGAMTPRVVALSAKLAKSGVMTTFTDLVVDDSLAQADVRLVVRAQ